MFVSFWPGIFCFMVRYSIRPIISVIFFFSFSCCRNLKECIFLSNSLALCMCVSVYVFQWVFFYHYHYRFHLSSFNPAFHFQLIWIGCLVWFGRSVGRWRLLLLLLNNVKREREREKIITLDCGWVVLLENKIIIIIWFGFLVD